MKLIINKANMTNIDIKIDDLSQQFNVITLKEKNECMVWKCY